MFSNINLIANDKKYANYIMIARINIEIIYSEIVENIVKMKVVKN